MNKLDNILNSLSADQINFYDQESQKQADLEYKNFKDLYLKGICYLCNKSFKTFSSENICLHSLLGMNKFKSKDFPKIYNRWGYFQIASYLRRVANMESYMKNINDLNEEKRNKYLFEYSIRWRHIERSFSCAESDFVGHRGRYFDEPHYHFQMRMNERVVIKFSKFHLPFNDYDFFIFDVQNSSKVKHSRGRGIGMEDGTSNLKMLPDSGLNELVSTSEFDQAQFHINTFISGEISSDFVEKVITESKRTGKTMAKIAKDMSTEGENIDVGVIISPSNKIHDISYRSG